MLLFLVKLILFLSFYKFKNANKINGKSEIK